MRRLHSSNNHISERQTCTIIPPPFLEVLLSSGADATCLCRFNKDQSAKEAPQISEMSDTAVSSLTANGLLFPASLFCSFFVAILLGPAARRRCRGLICNYLKQLYRRRNFRVKRRCKHKVAPTLCRSRADSCWAERQPWSSLSHLPRLNQLTSGRPSFNSGPSGDAAAAFQSPAPLVPHPHVPPITLRAPHVQHH